MEMFLRNQGHYLLAFFVLLIYLSPNIFFQDEAHLLTHDNLDSNVVWFKNIAESQSLFGESGEVVERTMNGLNRDVYVSEYRVIVWMYYLFSPQMAYHLNIILQHLIGFIGMFLLLRGYIFKNKDAKYVIVLISLSFALLPFWPSGGVGVAGMPLLFFSLLNIYNQSSSWKDWIWLVVFPLYSELILSGLFVVSLFSIVFGYKMIKKKELSYLIILSLFVLTITYIGCNYRLFQLVFIDGFESGRELMEFSYGKTLNIKGVLGLSFLEAVRGQHHFHTMAFPFLTVFVLLSFILIKRARQIVIIGFGLILFFEICDHVIAWDKMKPVVDKLEILSQVRFRWKSLTPFLWYFLFAKLAYLWVQQGYKKFLIPMIGLNVLFVMFSIGDGFRYNNEFAENAFYRTYFDRSNKQNRSFEEFYMLRQFNKLKEVVPVDTKVACLGILPEVAQFNNFNTFGGYYVLWPEEYEQLFKKALGSEFETELDHVFYLNSKELNQIDNDKKNEYVIKNLRLNFEVLKQEGVVYLFSSNPIDSKSLFYYTEIKERKRKSIFVYKL